jgi:hypothetical protein
MTNKVILVDDQNHTVANIELDSLDEVITYNGDFFVKQGGPSLGDLSWTVYKKTFARTLDQ